MGDKRTKQNNAEELPEYIQEIYDYEFDQKTGEVILTGRDGLEHNPEPSKAQIEGQKKQRKVRISI